jgi:hypothetical protein
MTVVDGRRRRSGRQEYHHHQQQLMRYTPTVQTAPLPRPVPSVIFLDDDGNNEVKDKANMAGRGSVGILGTNSGGRDNAWCLLLMVSSPSVLRAPRR